MGQCLKSSPIGSFSGIDHYGPGRVVKKSGPDGWTGPGPLARSSMPPGYYASRANERRFGGYINVREEWDRWEVLPAVSASFVCEVGLPWPRVG